MPEFTVSNNRLQLNPKSDAFTQNPYSLYQTLHTLGTPVYWENYGFWCVADYSSVNKILRHKEFARLPPEGAEVQSTPAHLQDFAQAEKYSLLALEPPEHTRLRKAVNHEFTLRKVERLIPYLRQLAQTTLQDLAKKQSADLLKDYATPIPIKVITHLLGVNQQAAEQLLQWSHDMVKVYTLTQTHEEECKANQAAQEFQAFLKNTLKHTKNNTQSTFLQTLLDTESDPVISEEEVISIAILLLNAGHEATVHQLGNAIYTLLIHYPIEKRKALLNILQDDTASDALISECMRFDAPLHLFTRYAQQRIVIDDTLTLEAGDQVGLLLGAANRCPTRFTQPNVFAPDRTDAGHLSLGAGIHFCVGAQLSKLELRIAVQELFYRFPNLQLANKARYQNSYHFHGLEQLLVTF